VHKRNHDNLTIWHNIGSDVDNGAWAIAGARLGTYKTMLTNWDYREVQDFDALESLWLEVCTESPDHLVAEHENDLHKTLDLPMNILQPAQSRFFKHHYRSNWKNQGLMVRE
jgi:hypothetical protein